jgi:hypothetical protein
MIDPPIVSKESPLKTISQFVEPRTVLFFNAVRDTAIMIDISYARLKLTLNQTSDSENRFATALLDAWAIVDSTHRLRGLIEEFHGLPKNTPEIKKFLNASKRAEELRHFTQHMRADIHKTSITGNPIWGTITWREDIEATKKAKSHILISGVMYKGLNVTLPLPYDYALPKGTIILSAYKSSVDVANLHNEVRSLISHLEAVLAKHFPTGYRGPTGLTASSSEVDPTEPQDSEVVPSFQIASGMTDEQMAVQEMMWLTHQIQQLITNHHLPRASQLYEQMKTIISKFGAQPDCVRSFLLSTSNIVGGYGMQKNYANAISAAQTIFSSYSVTDLNESCAEAYASLAKNAILACSQGGNTSLAHSFAESLSKLQMRFASNKEILTSNAKSILTRTIRACRADNSVEAEALLHELCLLAEHYRDDRALLELAKNGFRQHRFYFGSRPEPDMGKYPVVANSLKNER